jgi:uncharacterized membrane protein YdjX (TVP38/TMEM64 family)
VNLVSRVWAFHNTILLVASFALFAWFSGRPEAAMLLARVEELGYLGAALAGLFFTSTFTVVPAAIVLFNVAHGLDPFIAALAGGAGAVLGDLVLYRFLRDQVYEELAPVARRLGGNHLGLILKTPYFAWFAPVLGALIIASPFPDELGVSLLGLSKIKTWHFILIVYLANVAGVFAVVYLAQAL